MKVGRRRERLRRRLQQRECVVNAGRCKCLIVSRDIRERFASSFRRSLDTAAARSFVCRPAHERAAAQKGHDGLSFQQTARILAPHLNAHVVIATLTTPLLPSVAQAPRS